jgi:endonuclease/exonuclease/phosphatase family metal-dependent hydrolase
VKLITWNIQWGRRCDGRVDLARIVRVAREMADFDVLCLQEVSHNFPGLEGSGREDQFAALAGLLPGYAAIEGVAVDEPQGHGGPKRFGNLILTRLPVVRVLRHHLPWPADPEVPTMARVAVEAVVRIGERHLRVTTTHLEYYSAGQRAAQVERLRDLQAEAAGHAADRPHAKVLGGPFETRPRGSGGVLTGDFNFRPEDPLLERMQAALPERAPAWRDAWRLVHEARAHAPTVGLFDREQWPQPFCCDFVFVTADIAPAVRNLTVNADTDASDHQPVLLELDRRWLATSGGVA